MWNSHNAIINPISLKHLGNIYYTTAFLELVQEHGG